MPPTINETVDVFSLRPLLVDCQYMLGAMDLPRSEVQALLPDGYTAIGDLSPTFADVNLAVLSCSSIAVNNETLIPAVTLLDINARVAVNETLGTGSDADFYNLDMLVTNGSVFAVFKAVGLNPTLAEISLASSETSVELTATVAASPRYELTALPGVSEAPESNAVLRTHQSANGLVRWHDYANTYDMPGWGGPGTLTVHDGPLQPLAPAGQDDIAISNYLGASHGEMTFGGFPSP